MDSLNKIRTDHIELDVLPVFRLTNPKLGEEEEKL